MKELYNILIVGDFIYREEYALPQNAIISFARAFVEGESSTMLEGSEIWLSKISKFIVYHIDRSLLPLEYQNEGPRVIKGFIKSERNTYVCEENDSVEDFLENFGANVSGDYIRGGYRSGKGGRLLQPNVIESEFEQSKGINKKLQHAEVKNALLKVPMNTKSIFISHASKDEALVELFVHNFLRLGLEVPSRDIFCTSLAGMSIPSGDDFRNAIRDKIIDAELIFLLITHNYQQSQMCIAEMGAAWVLGKRVIPIIVPPIDYDSAGILVTPNQIIKLTEAIKLDQLKTDVEAILGIRDNVHLATWGVTRDKLLRQVLTIIEGESRQRSLGNPARNLETAQLKKWAGVYENIYICTPKRRIIGRNIYHIKSDGTVEFKSLKNIRYFGFSEITHDGRFLKLGPFHDADGIEYGYQTILRIPHIGEDDRVLYGIYSGIGQSNVIPKAGRDYFRKTERNFEDLMSGEFEIGSEGYKALLRENVNLFAFFSGKPISGDEDKYIDVLPEIDPINEE